MLTIAKYSESLRFIIYNGINSKLYICKKIGFSTPATARSKDIFITKLPLNTTIYPTKRFVSCPLWMSASTSVHTRTHTKSRVMVTTMSLVTSLTDRHITYLVYKYFI